MRSFSFAEIRDGIYKNELCNIMMIFGYQTIILIGYFVSAMVDVKYNKYTFYDLVSTLHRVQWVITQNQLLTISFSVMLELVV